MANAHTLCEYKIKMEQYSPKSFVVIGDTKPYKDQIKKLGGKWNPSLKCGAGWIFSNHHTEKVKTFIQSISEPVEEPTTKPVEEQPVEEQPVEEQPVEEQPVEEPATKSIRMTVSRINLLKAIAEIKGKRSMYKKTSTEELEQYLQALKLVKKIEDNYNA